MARKPCAKISPLLEPYRPEDPVPLTTPEAVQAFEDAVHQYVNGDPLEEMAQRWHKTLSDAGISATPGVPFLVLQDGRVLMSDEPEFADVLDRMVRRPWERPIFEGVKSYNPAGQLAALVEAKGHAFGTPVRIAAEILDSVHELRQLEPGVARDRALGALHRLEVRARIAAEYGEDLRHGSSLQPAREALAEQNARSHSETRARDEQWRAAMDEVLAVNPSAGPGRLLDAVMRLNPGLNRDYVRQRLARLRKEK